MAWKVAKRTWVTGETLQVSGREFYVMGRTDGQILIRCPDGAVLAIATGLSWDDAERIFAAYAQSLHRSPVSIRLLDVWSCILPIRIAGEDLGGFVEDIDRRLKRGQTWRVGLCAISAIFWTGLNAFGYGWSLLRGKWRSTRKRK
jgi:hypothetical protein